jgi:hypothetical protein
MEITKERLKELIIESLKEVLDPISSQAEQLDEISPRTDIGRGGWKGVLQYSKEGMEFLDSLAAKFNGQEEPEELAQAAKRFELMYGSAKTAIARDVAPTWATQHPEEMDKFSRKHRTSFYEEKENK